MEPISLIKVNATNEAEPVDLQNTKHPDSMTLLINIALWTASVITACLFSDTAAPAAPILLASIHALVSMDSIHKDVMRLRTASRRLRLWIRFDVIRRTRRNLRFALLRSRLRWNHRRLRLRFSVNTLRLRFSVLRSRLRTAVRRSRSTPVKQHSEPKPRTVMNTSISPSRRPRIEWGAHLSCIADPNAVIADWLHLFDFPAGGDWEIIAVYNSSSNYNRHSYVLHCTGGAAAPRFVLLHREETNGFELAPPILDRIDPEELQEVLYDYGLDVDEDGSIINCPQDYASAVGIEYDEETRQVVDPPKFDVLEPGTVLDNSAGNWTPLEIRTELITLIRRFDESFTYSSTDNDSVEWISEDIDALIDELNKYAPADHLVRFHPDYPGLITCAPNFDHADILACYASALLNQDYSAEEFDRIEYARIVAYLDGFEVVDKFDTFFGTCEATGLSGEVSTYRLRKIESIES